MTAAKIFDRILIFLSNCLQNIFRASTCTHATDYYHGRVGAGGLSVWLCPYRCVCVYKNAAVYYGTLLLKHCHEIALNFSVVEYLFFERRLQSRDSLLSRDLFILTTSPIKTFRYMGVPQL